MASEDKPTLQPAVRQLHTQDDTQVHDGRREDCPRCTPPGATEDQEWAAARERIRLQHVRMDEEAGLDLPPDAARYLVLPETAEERALTDTGQYYGVREGAILTRDQGRPISATLTEWLMLPNLADFYIAAGRWPLFGSVPLMAASDAPDIVGRVVELMSFLEKITEMTGQRIETLDQVVQRVANRPTHERELLRRAARMIDPDLVETMTYEERLDWLAKYREVTS